MVAELLSPCLCLRQKLFKGIGGETIVFQFPVLLSKKCGELLFQSLFVQDICSSDSASCRFILIARADASLSGSDLLAFASLSLFGAIESHMVRHDYMGSFVDEYAFDLFTCDFLYIFKFRVHSIEVYDSTGTYYIHCVVIEDT